MTTSTVQELQRQLEKLKNDPPKHLSEYEVSREQRILENKLFMANLGLDQFKPSTELAEERQRAQQERLLKRQQREATNNGIGKETENLSSKEDYEPRRSARSKGERPSYTGLDDNFDDFGYRPKVTGGMGGRRSKPGVRRVGGRIYDPVNGTSCHQCRQKTLDPKVTCTNEIEVVDDPSGIVRRVQCNVKMDIQCLENRYGETMDDDFVASGRWICPKCRDICNCSFCRKKKGLRPTGILTHAAIGKGYGSVAEFLAVQWGEGEKSWRTQADENSVTANPTSTDSSAVSTATKKKRASKRLEVECVFVSPVKRRRRPLREATSTQELAGTD